MLVSKIDAILLFKCDQMMIPNDSMDLAFTSYFALLLVTPLRYIIARKLSLAGGLSVVRPDRRLPHRFAIAAASCPMSHRLPGFHVESLDSCLTSYDLLASPRRERNPRFVGSQPQSPVTLFLEFERGWRLHGGSDEYPRTTLVARIRRRTYRSELSHVNSPRRRTMRRRSCAYRLRQEVSSAYVGRTISSAQFTRDRYITLRASV